MTGQTIKCQCADLGATGLHHDPLNISHSTPAATTGRREKKKTLVLHSCPFTPTNTVLFIV